MSTWLSVWPVESPWAGVCVRKRDSMPGQTQEDKFEFN